MARAKKAPERRPDTPPPYRLSAAYIRVSTPSQDLTYQRQAIDIAARGAGEKIDIWYADTATGASMKRPQWSALRTLILTRGVRTLWVWRLDRLTRSGVLDMLQAVRELKQCECAVRSVSDPYALEGPASELVLAVVAWCAQMEREKIRENQAAARARLEREGRSWGRPPLDPTLKEAARLARERHPGLSLREIAKGLNVSTKYVWRAIHENEPQAAAEIVPVGESPPGVSLVY